MIEAIATDEHLLGARLRALVANETEALRDGEWRGISKSRGLSVRCVNDSRRTLGTFVPEPFPRSSFVEVE